MSRTLGSIKIVDIKDNIDGSADVEIDMPVKLAKRLNKEADKLGLTFNEYFNHLLLSYVEEIDNEIQTIDNNTNKETTSKA